MRVAGIVPAAILQKMQSVLMAFMIRPRYANCVRRDRKAFTQNARREPGFAKDSYARSTVSVLLSFLLFWEVLRRCIGSPGIVVGSEGGAATGGWMSLSPELKEYRGVRFVEGACAEYIERAFGGLLRIGDDTVNGFLAVDVCGVLLAAAEGALHGLEDRVEDG